MSIKLKDTPVRLDSLPFECLQKIAQHTAEPVNVLLPLPKHYLALDTPLPRPDYGSLYSLLLCSRDLHSATLPVLYHITVPLPDQQRQQARQEVMLEHPRLCRYIRHLQTLRQNVIEPTISFIGECSSLVSLVLLVEPFNLKPEMMRSAEEKFVRVIRGLSSLYCESTRIFNIFPIHQISVFSRLQYLSLGGATPLDILQPELRLPHLETLHLRGHHPLQIVERYCNFQAKHVKHLRTENLYTGAPVWHRMFETYGPHLSTLQIHSFRPYDGTLEFDTFLSFCIKLSFFETDCLPLTPDILKELPRSLDGVTIHSKYNRMCWSCEGLKVKKAGNFPAGVIL